MMLSSLQAALLEFSYWTPELLEVSTWRDKVFGLTYYHHISGKMWHQGVVSRGCGGPIAVNESLCRIFFQMVSRGE